ncbi:hypothetical protein ACRTDU_18130 [Sunxiuqinia elliptica]
MNNKESEENSKRKVWKDIIPYFSFENVGHLFFLVFAIWSLIDASSRILITDPAYYLFNIINKEDFFIAGPRYTTVINQVLVVLGVKLGVSLKLLISLYSVSFVLIRYSYFLIVVKLLKNIPAGFAIIAFTLLGVAESYFRPTSESTIALLNSSLLYASLVFFEMKMVGKKKFVLQLLVTLLLVSFGYYTHPIAVFSLVFVVLFFSVFHQSKFSWYPVFALAIVLVTFGQKVLLGENSTHHSSLYGNLLSSPFLILQELSDYYPYKFFSNHFERLYLVASLLFIAAVILLALRKRGWMSSLLIVVSVVVYFIVACTSFKKGDANMQMEKIFLPMVFFLGIAFAEGVAALKRKRIKGVLLAATTLIVMLVGLERIGDVRGLYHGRIDYLKEIVHQANQESGKKLLIKSEQVDRKMVFTWGMGMETLMLSTIDKTMDPLTVYCIQGHEKLEGKKDDPENFLVTHFHTSFNYTQFNQLYFGLSEEVYKEWDVDLK